jgi:predicted DNA binding CopG/RHH family protein
MKNPELTPDEQSLLDALEAGQYASVLTAARKQELEAAAERTFRKDKRINIRISNADLVAIQSAAAEQGIPYQTLASSILHKYLSGSLQDVTVQRAERKR